MSIRSVDYSRTKILDGFWREKLDMVRNVTARAVYDRFNETGRIDAFSMSWREGMEKRPHFFWDSDVAKWIEGVAYILRDGAAPELEALCESIIDDIIEHQGEDGYFNIYFTVVAPGERFTDRDKHELYCAGHLMEAAVAYYEATGKRRFLDAMCKYADYIEKRFKIDRDTPYTVPGHEEIELALVRMWECTGERRYLELSEFFVNSRGCSGDKPISENAASCYDQSHLPVREQTTAEGHAVRAMYLYTAMARLAAIIGDEELLSACEELFKNITERRMYITGGVGSSSCGESFTVDYDLPNLMAYSESCAAIGLAFFCRAMSENIPDSKYADVAERALYNGILSSTSLDGKSFFYENPLETLPYLATKDRSTSWNRIKYPRHTRLEVFGCSCCPPNVVRFIPSVANLIYGDDGETIFVHQFICSETEIERAGQSLRIVQSTDYPRDGKIKITLERGSTRLAVRIPYWVKNYDGPTDRGYAYFDLREGESVELDFDMSPRFVFADSRVDFCAGKCAVMRGPIVYCIESVDNGEHIRNLKLNLDGELCVEGAGEFLAPALTAEGVRAVYSAEELYSDRRPALTPVSVRLIPYYAFANRGAAEMRVFIPYFEK